MLINLPKVLWQSASDRLAQKQGQIIIVIFLALAIQCFADNAKHQVLWLVNSLCLRKFAIPLTKRLVQKRVKEK